MNCIDENLIIPFLSLFIISFISNCYCVYQYKKARKRIPLLQEMTVKKKSTKKKSHLPAWVVNEFLEDRGTKV